MGLGPPVCLTCMTLLIYEDGKRLKGEEPWLCMKCGPDDGTIKTTHIFSFPKEVKEEIYKRSKPFRFKRPPHPKKNEG